MCRIECFQDALIVDGAVIAHELISDIMLSSVVVVVIGWIAGIKLLLFAREELFDIGARGELSGQQGRGKNKPK